MKSLTLSICLLFFVTCIVHAQTNTIQLDYDKSANKIKDPQDKSLNKGSYRFQITGLNDAFHTGKFTPEYLNKVSTLPANLSSLFPVGNSAISSVQPNALYSHLTPNGTVRGTGALDATFTDKIEKDYAYIRQVVVSTKQMLDYVKTNWSDLPLCKKEEDDDFKNINNLTSSVSSLNVTKPKDLKQVVESVISDLINRVEIIRTNDKLSGQLDIEKLNDMYKAEEFVKQNQDFIKSSPDMLDAVLNCSPQILTEAYDIKTDYFRLNVSILQNRFANKPDTLFKQKITFYRKNYVKLIDVSSGFFFNNLYSRSYYFRDTLGHTGTESKSKSDLAIGALVHAYYVVSDDFKVGLGLGAAVSVLDGKTKYLFGPSLVFGKRKEFIISGGVAMASLAVPSNVLGNGQTYTSATSTGAVPTYNSIAWGYFVGLSYSFVKL